LAGIVGIFECEQTALRWSGTDFKKVGIQPLLELFFVLELNFQPVVKIDEAGDRVFVGV
jgi:hypothetical protein